MSCANLKTWGGDDDTHLHNLSAIVEKLQHNGVCIKRPFTEDEVTYLGQKIDSEYLHNTLEKAEVVFNTLEPHNVQQLSSFLGLVNYYCKFL